MRGAWREVSDEQLVAATVSREPGAWQAFHERHERLIASCVRRTLARYTAWVSEEDVEDVVSAVCLNLVKDDYRRLRAFDPGRGSRLSSWVGLIATNTALDALRRREPRHASLATGGPASEPLEVAAPAPDAAATLARREEVAAVLGAMATLSREDREFIELMYDRDLPPEQIAGRLRISVNTVYSRKNKVREKLRRAIEGGKVRKTTA